MHEVVSVKCITWEEMVLALVGNKVSCDVLISHQGCPMVTLVILPDLPCDECICCIFWHS